MINLVAFTISLVVWVVIWAVFKAKALDAALIPAFLIIPAAAAVYVYKPLLRKTLGWDDDES